MIYSIVFIINYKFYTIYHFTDFSKSGSLSLSFPSSERNCFGSAETVRLYGIKVNGRKAKFVFSTGKLCIFGQLADIASRQLSGRRIKHGLEPGTAVEYSIVMGLYCIAVEYSIGESDGSCSLLL